MTDIELDRIVTLKRAAELMGVSVQTLRRAHMDKFIRLSPRRLGMRLRDALILDVGEPRVSRLGGKLDRQQGSEPKSRRESNSQDGREGDGGTVKLSAVRPGKHTGSNVASFSDNS